MDDGVIEDAVDVETDLNDGHLTRLYTCYPGLPTKTGLILEKKKKTPKFLHRGKTRLYTMSR